MKDRTTLAELPDYDTDAWLLDSYVKGVPGGTGEKFNWELAVEAKRLGKQSCGEGCKNGGLITNAKGATTSEGLWTA